MECLRSQSIDEIITAISTAEDLNRFVEELYETVNDSDGTEADTHSALYAIEHLARESLHLPELKSFVITVFSSSKIKNETSQILSDCINSQSSSLIKQCTQSIHALSIVMGESFADIAIKTVPILCQGLQQALNERKPDNAVNTDNVSNPIKSTNPVQNLIHEIWTQLDSLEEEDTHSFGRFETNYTVLTVITMIAQKSLINGTVREFMFSLFERRETNQFNELIASFLNQQIQDPDQQIIEQCSQCVQLLAISMGSKFKEIAKKILSSFLSVLSESNANTEGIDDAITKILCNVQEHDLLVEILEHYKPSNEERIRLKYNIYVRLILKTWRRNKILPKTESEYDIDHFLNTLHSFIRNGLQDPFLDITACAEESSSCFEEQFGEQLRKSSKSQSPIPKHGMVLDDVDERDHDQDQDVMKTVDASNTEPTETEINNQQNSFENIFESAKQETLAIHGNQDSSNVSLSSTCKSTQQVLYIDGPDIPITANTTKPKSPIRKEHDDPYFRKLKFYDMDQFETMPDLRDFVLNLCNTLNDNQVNQRQGKMNWKLHLAALQILHDLATESVQRKSLQMFMRNVLVDPQIVNALSSALETQILIKNKEFEVEIIKQCSETVHALLISFKIRFREITKRIFLPFLKGMNRSNTNCRSFINSAIISMIRYLKDTSLMMVMIDTFETHLDGDNSEHMDNNDEGNNDIIRWMRYCGRYVELMLKKWPITTMMNEEINKMDEFIGNCLSSQNKEIRQIMTKSFWFFVEHFPERKESMLESMEPTWRAMILNKSPRASFKMKKHQVSEHELFQQLGFRNADQFKSMHDLSVFMMYLLETLDNDDSKSTESELRVAALRILQILAEESLKNKMLMMFMRKICSDTKVVNALSFALKTQISVERYEIIKQCTLTVKALAISLKIRFQNVVKLIFDTFLRGMSRSNMTFRQFIDEAIIAMIHNVKDKALMNLLITELHCHLDLESDAHSGFSTKKRALLLLHCGKYFHLMLKEWSVSGSMQRIMNKTDLNQIEKVLSHWLISLSITEYDQDPNTNTVIRCFWLFVGQYPERKKSIMQNLKSVKLKAKIIKEKPKVLQQQEKEERTGSKWTKQRKKVALSAGRKKTSSTSSFNGPRKSSVSMVDLSRTMSSKMRQRRSRVTISGHTAPGKRQPMVKNNDAEKSNESQQNVSKITKQTVRRSKSRKLEKLGEK